MNLQAQFKLATQHLQRGAVEKASEVQRWRMYGLSKQANEGNCKIPSPPSADVKAKWKWDAWNNFKGLSPEDAMKAFVAEVSKVDSAFKIPTSSDPSPSENRISTVLLSMIKKEGTLFKQRDIFKGWRPRHFVLQAAFLHYYTNKDDDVPHKSLDLRGCTVSPIKSSKSGEIMYFPFVLSKPKV